MNISSSNNIQKSRCYCCWFSFLCFLSLSLYLSAGHNGKNHSFVKIWCVCVCLCVLCYLWCMLCSFSCIAMEKKRMKMRSEEMEKNISHLSRVKMDEDDVANDKVRVRIERVDKMRKLLQNYSKRKEEREKIRVANATKKKSTRFSFSFLFQRKFYSDWAKTFKIA